MADNYQKFSELVPAIIPKERAWIERVLEATEATAEQQQVLREAGIRPDTVDPEYWPGFEWKLDADTPDLWLYAEDYGNVSHVGEFVRAFLARFRPDDCWHVT